MIDLLFADTAACETAVVLLLLPDHPILFDYDPEFGFQVLYWGEPAMGGSVPSLAELLYIVYAERRCNPQPLEVTDAEQSYSPILGIGQQTSYHRQAG